MRLAAGRQDAAISGSAVAARPVGQSVPPGGQPARPPTPTTPEPARGPHNLTRLPRFTSPGSRLKFLQLTWHEFGPYVAANAAARQSLANRADREATGRDDAGVSGPKMPVKNGSFHTITQHPKSVRGRAAPDFVQTKDSIPRFIKVPDRFFFLQVPSLENQSSGLSRFAHSAGGKVAIQDQEEGRRSEDRTGTHILPSPRPRLQRAAGRFLFA